MDKYELMKSVITVRPNTFTISTANVVLILREQNESTFRRLAVLAEYCDDNWQQKLPESVIRLKRRTKGNKNLEQMLHILFFLKEWTLSSSH